MKTTFDRVLETLGLTGDESVVIEGFVFDGKPCIGWTPIGTATGDQRPFDIRKPGTIRPRATAEIEELARWPL